MPTPEEMVCCQDVEEWKKKITGSWDSSGKVLVIVLNFISLLYIGCILDTSNFQNIFNVDCHRFVLLGNDV